MELVLTKAINNEDFNILISDHFKMDITLQREMPSSLVQLLLQIYAYAQGPNDVITFLTTLRGFGSTNYRTNSIILAAGYALMNENVNFKHKLFVNLSQSNQSINEPIHAIANVVNQFITFVMPQLENHYFPPLKLNDTIKTKEMGAIKHLFGPTWVKNTKYLSQVTQK